MPSCARIGTNNPTRKADVSSQNTLCIYGAEVVEDEATEGRELDFGVFLNVLAVKIISSSPFVRNFHHPFEHLENRCQWAGYLSRLVMQLFDFQLFLRIFVVDWSRRV